MSRNTGDRLDRVPEGEVIYSEKSTPPTLADFTEFDKSSSKLRSDNLKIIWDNGSGVRRIYYITSRGNLVYTELSGSSGTGSAAFIYFVVSQATLTTGNDKIGRLYVDFAGTVTEVWACVSTAPTGATIIFDVNLNGTAITAGSTIATGSYTSTTTSFVSSTVAADDYFTIDVDQVGSTVAGSKLVVRVTIART